MTLISRDSRNRRDRATSPKSERQNLTVDYSDDID
jgi:hypothetical protein